MKSFCYFPLVLRKLNLISIEKQTEKCIIRVIVKMI